MKFFILLILTLSCGKHQMPDEQDFRDSDGDQVLNKDEVQVMEKYIARTVPMEKIEAELEFYTGNTTPTKHTFQLSNLIDLDNYSKDLLVKNLNTIKESEHFTEFSTLVPKKNDNSIVFNQEMYKVHLRFSTKKATPQRLYLSKGGLKTLLGGWKPLMQVELTQNQLSEIISGESVFFLSFIPSNEESIGEKTFRVLVNDGTKTTVHYISKELSLKEILAFLGINTYKLIDDQNLLTTGIHPDFPEWWIRQFGDNFIIVKEELSILAGHYLKDFIKTSYELKRVNGVAHAPFTFTKPLHARTLLRIQGTKTYVGFAESVREYRQGGGRDGNQFDCEDFYRQPLPEKNTALDISFLINQLDLNQHNIELRQFNAASNLHWEAELPQDIENFSLRLNNLGPKEYVPTGLYSSTCKSTRPSMMTSEGRLNLKFDVFVEKI